MDQELLKLVKLGRSGKSKPQLESIEDEEYYDLLQATPRGNTALHIASKSGNTNFVQEIALQCPQLLLSQNSRGDTALHVAARTDKSELMSGVLFLCAARKGGGPLVHEMLVMQNGEGNTVLHEAARNPHERLVQALVAANEMLLLVSNKCGATPLYVAAEGGCLESVETMVCTILDKIPEENRRAAFAGPNWRTPLHAAVIREDYEITETLVNKIQELLEKKDEDGNSPVHYAAAMGNVDIVKLLLQHNSRIAYDEDNRKNSPLHVAASNGHTDVIKELIEVIPDANEIVDMEGSNVFHVAAEKGNLDLVRFILNNSNALMFKELINQRNGEGNTPLHLAIINNQLMVSSLLITDERVDKNVVNDKGETPLDTAECSLNVQKKFQKILVCGALIQAGGRRALRQRDKLCRKARTDSFKQMSKVILMIATGLITASFASAIAVPDNFQKKECQTLVWLFIIFNSFSLFAAIFIAIVLLFASVGDDDILLQAIYISIPLMALALLSLILAFVFAITILLHSRFTALVPSMAVFLLFCGLCFFCRRFPLLNLYLFPPTVPSASTKRVECGQRQQQPPRKLPRSHSWSITRMLNSSEPPMTI